jgi:hypothetical protein
MNNQLPRPNSRQSITTSRLFSTTVVMDCVSCIELAPDREFDELSHPLGKSELPSHGSTELLIGGALSEPFA